MKESVGICLSFAVLTGIPLIGFTNRKLAFLCVGLMPIYGFTLEYLQKSIGGREFSPEDLLANNGGIVIGVACGLVIRMLRRVRREKEGWS